MEILAVLKLDESMRTRLLAFEVLRLASAGVHTQTTLCRVLSAVVAWALSGHLDWPGAMVALAAFLTPAFPDETDADDGGSESARNGDADMSLSPELDTPLLSEQWMCENV